jgi:hypothetical protein
VIEGTVSRISTNARPASRAAGSAITCLRAPEVRPGSCCRPSNPEAADSTLGCGPSTPNRRQEPPLSRLRTVGPPAAPRSMKVRMAPDHMQQHGVPPLIPLTRR